MGRGARTMPELRQERAVSYLLSLLQKHLACKHMGGSALKLLVTTTFPFANAVVATRHSSLHPPDERWLCAANPHRSAEDSPRHPHAVLQKRPISSLRNHNKACSTPQVTPTPQDSQPLVPLWRQAPPRTIQAFGRLARKGGCKSSSASGSVGSTSARSRPLASCLLWAWAAAELMLRQRNLDFLAPPCKRCWRRLAAQL